MKFHHLNLYNMLHSSNPRSFVCWQCLNKYGQTIRYSKSRFSKCQAVFSKFPSSRTFISSSQELISVESQSGAEKNPGLPASVPKLNIRERLALWEKENTPQLTPEDKSSLTNSPIIENVLSAQTDAFLAQTSSKADTEESHEDDTLGTQDIEDGIEGVKRDFLIPGDLVDLRFGGNSNELAIFVQRLDLQSQYYTMSGRWLHQRTTNVNIYFPKFVEFSEVDELKKYLPEEDVPLDKEASLDGFPQALPRSIGGPLLRKMRSFLTQANAVYEATASKLDKSYIIVAHPTKFQYATISELADIILTGIVSREKDGNFPDPALYALHRRIFCESIGFTPANLRKARGEAQYEILPVNLTKEMWRVVCYVRKLNKYKLTHGKSEQPTEINAFSTRAFDLIRKSRETRDFTEYGNIGPYRGNSEDEFKSVRREKFTGTDLEFVRFLEVWAGLNSLGTMIGCTYDSVGSTILRAIGQYNDQNTLLNKQTAWTCLKELGAIHPWQVVSEYGIRAPSASCRLSLSPVILNEKIDYSVDKMKDLRTDWKNLTTYCIDDVDALELDDAISLCTTESPEEYWVHIHVADPTSIYSPHGPESKYAQARGNTVFLPGCKVPMLDHEAVMEHMSLDNGRPCLTFSAKLNLKGELLESEIRPGILRNVICLTPKTFTEITNSATISEIPFTYSVGPNYASNSPSRPLANKDQLSEKEKNELKILGKLGEARTKLLQKKGAAFIPNEQESVKIFFNPSILQKLSGDFLMPNVDPSIQIKLSGSYQDFVVGHSIEKKFYETALSAFMQLAGQIAASWCQKRGIPIPYRVALPQKINEDPANYHRLNMLPLIEKGHQIPKEMVSRYLALIGPAHLSTEPAPHPALAMKAYTKVTSPLRRYLDMVVHWQINAAFREEALSGKKLLGNKAQDFLPFTKSWINSILPHMTRLERWAKYYELSSVQEWKCQFLLRVWKYGQSTLPSPFVFIARRTVLGNRHSIFGELPCIAMKALMEVPSFMKFDEIVEGDLFEVMISDINVHMQKVSLKALRKLKLEDIPKLGQAPGT